MNRKLKTTKKITKSKNQILGVRQLVDKETGEEISALEAIQETADINWHKVWITHLIQTLDIVGNKKMKVVNYILDNLDWSSNILIKTQREIAVETEVGYNTVNTTLQLLVESNFLRAKTGVYMLNPDILAYGGSQKRKHLLISFEQFGTDLNNEKEKSPEQKSSEHKR